MPTVPTASELRTAYWDQGETLASLGRKYGRAPGSVAGWFKKYQIPTRSCKQAKPLQESAVTAAEIEQMKTLHAEGLSSYDIGEKLGRDGRLVRTHLKNAGALRTREEGVRNAVATGKIRNRTLNETFFDVLTPASAWVLGLIYGDGHVANNPKIGQYQVTLAGSEQVCSAVQALLGLDKSARQAKESRPVATRGEVLRCWILQWSSRIMVNTLSTHGLGGGNKACTMAFPKLETELLPHFVRGLWDADGHWNRLGYAMYACSSEVFIDALCALLVSKGWAPRKEVHRTELNGKQFIGYRLRLLAHHSRELAQWLYLGSEKIRCQRKFQIALREEVVP